MPRPTGGRHNVGVARRRGRRGEGSVYRSQGSWIASFPLGTSGGKRRSKRARFKSEQAALAELEQLRRTYGAGGEPITGTLGEYLADWIRGHARNVRPRTAEKYRGHIEGHIDPLLGGIPVSQLRPADVRRLIDQLDRRGLQAATIGAVITTLKTALNQAVADRSIADNPAKVRLPRIELKPVHPVDHVAADAIRDAVTGHWIEHIARLLLGSGLRRGEAIGLDQRDLMLADGYVRVRITKTHARAVPVSADAVEALREAIAIAPRIGPNEPVFFSPHLRRERMRPLSVSHALPRVLAAAGLPPLSPHKLRHAAATIMLADGHPMRVIAEQLGHRNPALTARIYAHVMPSAQVDAVRSLDRRSAR